MDKLFYPQDSPIKLYIDIKQFYPCFYYIVNYHDKLINHL